MSVTDLVLVQLGERVWPDVLARRAYAKLLESTLPDAALLEVRRVEGGHSLMLFRAEQPHGVNRAQRENDLADAILQAALPTDDYAISQLYLRSGNDLVVQKLDSSTILLPADFLVDFDYGVHDPAQRARLTERSREFVALLSREFQLPRYAHLDPQPPLSRWVREPKAASGETASDWPIPADRPSDSLERTELVSESLFEKLNRFYPLITTDRETCEMRLDALAELTRGLRAYLLRFGFGAQMSQHFYAEAFTEILESAAPPSIARYAVRRQWPLRVTKAMSELNDAYMYLSDEHNRTAYICLHPRNVRSSYLLPEEPEQLGQSGQSGQSPLAAQVRRTRAELGAQAAEEERVAKRARTTYV
ncbi:Hypothetical protein UVM_LOCUS356 [uncultured virus]|nr:Hypothetical protein UVM_LOCUS356 [uncultured virus]